MRLYEAFLTTAAVTTSMMIALAALWWNIDSRIVLIVWLAVTALATLAIYRISNAYTKRRKGYINYSAIVINKRK